MREGEARKIEEELPTEEKTGKEKNTREEELAGAIRSLKQSEDPDPLISFLQSANLSDIDYRAIILDKIAYNTPENLMPLLKKLLATTENASTESGAHLLLTLEDLAHFGIHYYSSGDMMAEAKDMLQSFAATTHSVLLRRKAQSLIESEEDTSKRTKFQHKKTNTEKKFDTEDISVSGLKLSAPDGALYDLPRNKVTIMPVSKDFLGVFDQQFGFNCLLKKKREKIYLSQEIIDLKNLPMLSDEPNLNEASRKYRAQAQRDYLMLLDIGIIAGIERDYGFPFRDLPLREQIWFASYLRELKIDDENKIQRFAKKFGLNGARVFLSLEYTQEMGDKILSIGENLDRESALAIFAKYSEIVDTAEDAREYLQKTFCTARDYSAETVDQIIQNLLRKGKYLLTHFSKKAAEAKGKISPKEILVELGTIKTEILLFAATFKAVSAEQKVEFSDVAGVELKTPDSSELTAKEKKEMEKIFVGNRTTYSKKLLAATRQEFSEAMNTPGKKFYLLTHEGNLVSFLRFDQLPNGNLYLGSVNVRPEVRGSAIGSAMLKAAIDQEAGDRNLEAVVYEKNPVLKHYLEDFGFKIVGEIPDYHGTGQKFLKIERPAGRKAIKKRQPTQEFAAAA